MLPALYSPLKRFYKFVLKKIIGRFLLDEFDVDQIDVDLSKGEVILYDLHLDVDVLNDLLRDVPLRVISAKVSSIRATIPWRTILSSHCSLQIDGFDVLMCPSAQYRSGPEENHISLLEELNRSLSSLSAEDMAEQISLHRKLQQTLAFEDDDNEDEELDATQQSRTSSTNTPMDDEGIEVVASFIENIASRTEVTLSNMCVRVQHEESNGETSRLLLHLPSISYSDAVDSHDSSAGVSSRPTFEYMKEVRFQGFRVELIDAFHIHHSHHQQLDHHLQRDDEHAATICFGDADQQCSIRIRALLSGQDESRVDLSCFVRSLGVFCSPSQLSVLHRMGSSVAFSAALLARKEPVKTKASTAMPEPVSLPQRLTSTDLGRFANILNDFKEASESAEMFASFDSVEFHDCESISSSSSSSSSSSNSPERDPSRTNGPVNPSLFSSRVLWSLKLNLHEVTLTLLETEAQLQKSASNDPRAYSSPMTDHIVFHAKGSSLVFCQSSTGAWLDFRILQLELLESIWDDSCSGFERHSLLSFQAAVDATSPLSSSAPIAYKAQFSLPDPSSSSLKRVSSLSIAKTTISIDIGLWNRLDGILRAFDTASSSHTQGFSSSGLPDSSTRVETSSLTLIISFDHRNQEKLIIVMNDVEAVSQPLQQSDDLAQWRIQIRRVSLDIEDAIEEGRAALLELDTAVMSLCLRRFCLSKPRQLPDVQFVNQLPFRTFESEPQHDDDVDAFERDCRDTSPILLNVELRQLRIFCTKTEFDICMRLYERLSPPSDVSEVAGAEPTTSVESLKFMFGVSAEHVLICLQEQVLNESFLFELRELKFSDVSCTSSAHDPLSFITIAASSLSLVDYGAGDVPHNWRDPTPATPLLYSNFRPRNLDQQQQQHHQQRRLSVVALLRPDYLHRQRDVLLVVLMRGVAWQYSHESEWASKIMNFFTQTPEDDNNNNCSKGLSNLTKLFVTWFDMSIDYFYPELEARPVLLFDRLHLSSLIVDDSPTLKFKVDVQGLTACMQCQKHGVVSKVSLRSPSSASSLGPALDGLDDDSMLLWANGNLSSLMDKLFLKKFVKIVTLDYLEMNFTKNPESFHTELSGGLLSFLFCSDSLYAFQSFVEHYTSNSSPPPPTPATVTVDVAVTDIDDAIHSSMAFTDVDGSGVKVNDGNHYVIGVIGDYMDAVPVLNSSPIELQEEEHIARWFDTDSRLIVEDFFTAPLSAGASIDATLSLPDEMETPISSFIIRTLNLSCTVFGGNDYDLRRESGTADDDIKHHYPVDGIAEVEEKVDAERSFGFALHETGTASPSGLDAFVRWDDADEEWQPEPHVPDAARDTDNVLELRLSSLRLRSDTFRQDPESSKVCVRRLSLASRELQVIDEISTSVFKMALQRLYRGADETELDHGASDDILRLKLETMNSGADMNELRLRLDLLPLQLNLDQDTLEFLLNFSNRNVTDTNTADHEADAEESLSYFQYVDVRSLALSLSYTPKRIDFSGLRAGDYAQLVHFFPLERANIDLKRVQLRGVEGLGSVVGDVLAIWANDVAKSQAHRYVAGVQPIRSIVKVGSGMADLVFVPVQQYRRDGRLGHGLRQGVQSMTLETIDLAMLLFGGAQGVLESVDSILYSRGSRVRGRHHRQPDGVREGLRQAYSSLSRAMQSASKSLVAVPMKEYAREGTGGCVKSVVRGVPSALIKPMIGVTSAVSSTLLGLRNTVEPDRARDDEDRYKRARSRRRRRNIRKINS